MAIFVSKRSVLHEHDERTYFALLHHTQVGYHEDHEDQPDEKILDVFFLIIKTFVFVLYVINIIVEETGNQNCRTEVQ